MSTDEAPIQAPTPSVLALASPLSRAELFVVLLHVVHTRHGTYYNPYLSDLMTTTSTSSTSSTIGSINPWDGKTLMFRANNAQLPGQVYVRTSDGSVAEAALRGQTPGSRYPVATRLPIPDDEGVDFARDFGAFEEGPVCVTSDQSLIDRAVQSPGLDFIASPRDASALIVHELSDTPDAPDAPVTVHDEPAPATEPEQPIHNGPITLTVDEHTQAKSLLSRLEAHVAEGGHWMLDELKALLRHV